MQWTQNLMFLNDCHFDLLTFLSTIFYILIEARTIQRFNIKTNWIKKFVTIYKKKNKARIGKTFEEK
jgi:hypothetical protein